MGVAVRFMGVEVVVVQVVGVLCHCVRLCTIFSGIVPAGSVSVVHWSCVY